MTLRIQKRSRLGLWLPAVSIVFITWLIFGMAQEFPRACILTGPCPREDARAGPALLFGGMMLAPLLAIIITSIFRTPMVWLVRLSYCLLVVLAVVGYGFICFSAGFTVDGLFLVGLVGVCSTAALAYRGTSALRRDVPAAPVPGQN